MISLKGYVSIAQADLLHICDPAPGYGADQEWYGTEWQRKSGCGPTSCAHLLWYLSRTRLGCGALCPYDGFNRAGFVRLMEDVWQYITPGRMGVNSTSIFTRGAVRYAQDRGLHLHCRVLNIPLLQGDRPEFTQVAEFLECAFEDDLPVAFLNLSNGTLTNLENWHWVTLVAASGGKAMMYDACERTEIDLETWLRTTRLGGGFVALEPDVTAA